MIAYIIIGLHFLHDVLFVPKCRILSPRWAIEKRHNTDITVIAELRAAAADDIELQSNWAQVCFVNFIYFSDVRYILFCNRVCVHM